MLKSTKGYAMIDLHGLSLVEAERIVNYWLATAGRSGIEQIRLVTGRGNHVNAKGERGTLYKHFLTWIEHSAYKDRVEHCAPQDGYYEITLKSSEKAHPLTNFFKTMAPQWMASEVGSIKTRAEAGDAYFQMLYAKLLESGEGIQQDFKQAAKFYRSAADKHYPAAIHELARCYLHGVGVRQSDKHAFNWLEKGHGSKIA